MNTHQLFRRSRIRLALWYALVMGIILSLSGLGMYRALVQSNWTALEREIESIAGTLHDSLEPMLPASENPAVILQQIFPELCLAGQPCNVRPTLMQRHTIGISDRNTYYIRLFDYQGKLLAFSPNQPSQRSQTLNSTTWQTINTTDRVRYRQFTTILHSAENHITAQNQLSWGYLQIGRTLKAFDAEVRRIQFILALGFLMALVLVAVSSWGLSGLAMQPIYQSYQQQQQFTANAAHELRSPLASLLATVEAILRVPPSNQQNIDSMLNTIERQGRRLSHLIADLLLLSRLEQDTVSKPFQPCCLNDIVSDLSEEFLELAVASNIQLSSDVPEQLISVFGDEQQLYRLISNLIANAIQYTPTGGAVHISLKQRNRTAIISIKDTGIGISPTEQRRIFERFYRVNSVRGAWRKPYRSRQTGGTGLGLAIAQAIALKHRADVRVESELGKGSLFRLEIPIVA